MTALFYPDDPSAWTSREVLRLLLVPTIATLLFVGGIYWIRLQPPSRSGEPRAELDRAGSAAAESTPAPIPVAPVHRSRGGGGARQPDRRGAGRIPIEALDNTAATLARAGRCRTEPTVPSLRPAPSPADAPPNSVAAKFQQALLRHVARYQRYPRRGAAGTAARRGRDVLFHAAGMAPCSTCWVKTSSGQAVLDRAAMDAIRRASRCR